MTPRACGALQTGPAVAGSTREADRTSAILRTSTFPPKKCHISELNSTRAGDGKCLLRALREMCAPLRSPKHAPVDNHICEGRTVPTLYRTHKGRNLRAALAAGTVIASGFATPSLADKKNDAKTITPIRHLVVIFGENISFDHYFATY